MGASGPGDDGHAETGGHGDAHGEHGAAGMDGGGSVRSLWGRDVSMDMPKERAYPPYRVPWVTTAGLVLSLVGIFWIGLYPAWIVDLLQSAARSLFAS
jgi:hypothetical protein